MRLIEFPERTVVYAKDQPEYEPLPAYQQKDREQTIICCWQLTWKERLRLLFTGKLWHSVLTFGSALQPQRLQVEKPDMPPHPKPAPSGTVACGHCKTQFKKLDGWCLVTAGDNGKAQTSSRTFCSERCAKEFGSAILGNYQARHYSY